jgi:hypothetical protein
MSMAKSKTVHVVPTGDGWAVKGAGRKRDTFSTQAEAIRAARTIVRDSVSGQFVVLKRDGQVIKHETHRLPKVKKPLQKSRLGSKKIEKAVGSVVLDRINADPPPPRV